MSCFYRKGQTEVYFVIAIIVIAALVMFFALQGNWSIRPGVPQATSQRIDLVRDSVMDIARDGAERAIKIVTVQGGYSDTPDDYAIFSNIAVPYWQKCGEKFIVPKNVIKIRIEELVKEYILAADFNNFSERAEFDLSKLVVSANILDNKIDFDILLPVTVDGHEISEPYVISIPTKLGRIIDFATDLVNENSKERYFELFTWTSIEMNPDIPTNGMIAKCGCEYISADKLSKLMNDVVENVLINTFWWVPLHTAPNNNRAFPIENLNGKQYADLKINMFKEDGFSFESSGPVKMCATDPILSLGPYRWGECFGAYRRNYSLYYPIIFSVKDSFTNNDFHFAVFVGLKESEDDMGECDIDTGVSTDDQCLDLGCNARIETIDYLNRDPVPGVYVDFAGCPLGTTNSKGIVEGPVKCGNGELILSSPDYETIFKNGGQYEINGTYEMRKFVNTTFNFFMLNTTSCQTSEPNNIVYLDLNQTDGDRHFIVANLDSDCIDNCNFEADNAADCVNNCISNIATHNIIPGTYMIQSNQTNSTGENIEVIETNRNLAGGNIFVYIPIPHDGKTTQELMSEAEGCEV